MKRNLWLVFGLPIAAVVVAVLVLLALTGSSLPPPDTLPVPVGTVLHVSYGHDVSIHFSTSSEMTLVGAWMSDAPAGTEVVSAGYECFPLGGACKYAPPGCSATYNVTLSPGTYILDLGAPYMQSANITVTQTLHLIPAVGNATPMSDVWVPSIEGACPA